MNICTVNSGTSEKKSGATTVEQMELILSALATCHRQCVECGLWKKVEFLLYHNITLCKLQFTSTTTAHCRF